MKMEQTECSETSAYKLQTPGNYPKESIEHTEHGKSLKLRVFIFFVYNSLHVSSSDQSHQSGANTDICYNSGTVLTMK